MKYRDHSLRYIPRKPAPSRPRVARHASTPADNDDPFFTHAHHDEEPLIDVNDKDSRRDKAKNNIGTLAHAALHLVSTYVLPNIRRTVQTTTHALVRHAPKLASTVRSASTKKKVHVMVAVSLIVLIGYAYMQKSSPTNSSGNATGSSSQEPVGGTSPQYQTLTPSGKDVEEFGGWKRVSPPSSNPVFAYSDTIDRIQISVSQQPLPRDFSSDPDKDIKELAEGFNANDRHVADDATVYFIGTSSKGPQSVILSKKDTLILIKAPAQIKPESWSAYIATLQ